MLEFKNTSIRFPDGNQSKPFSLVVNDGEIVCLCGSQGSGKSLMLQAVLGMWPVATGFITFDGEIISPGSASYFRNMIAYIPQDLPTGKLSVGEMLKDLLHNDDEDAIETDNKELMEEWQKSGLSKSLLDKSLEKIDSFTLQQILMSFLPLLNRKIILVDNIVQTSATHSFLLQLASAGSEIIYTCRENRMECDKIVNL